MPATLPEAPDSAGIVLVPGGRGLTLRPIAPEDEILLLDTADMLPSERGSRLLGRCLEGGEAVAGSLTVGDREALLLHLRRLSMGEILECVLRCPLESCGERMEFTVTVSDLLLPPYADVRPSYETTAQDGEAQYRVRFRVPTADDLDAAAALARRDPALGVREILRRCVLRADRDGAAVDGALLSETVRAVVAAAMIECDPQAELEIDLRCPACATPFSALFDAATFLLGELDGHAVHLMSEVHALALSYHWSEAEILRMPARRRARYLELVTASRAPVSPR